MDLTPYLKMLIEKKADELAIIAGATALLKLNGQDRSVGKALTADMTKAAAYTLLNKSQLKQLAESKNVEFEYVLPDNGACLTATVTHDGTKGVTLVFKPKANGAATNKPAAAAAPSGGKQVVTELPKDDYEGYEVLGARPVNGLDILPYLRKVIETEGSDLFITNGSPVKAKIQGKAIAMDRYIVTPELSKSAAYGIMTDQQIEEFERTHDLDFAIEMPDGSARFRANAFFQRRTIGLVLRLIPSKIPTATDLGLPEVLLEIIMQKRGLILMVGGTGSGKSTTLAAMVDYRNASSPGHILTIEDPIEFSHPNKKSIVNQREVGVDTVSYARALKASLREAPDVILIGEIRDREVMEAALELCNTGHLCISTMHANNANQAMERVVNMFPHEHHKQLFMDLSQSLRAVISQRLIPDVRNKRCAAIEILINTPHIGNLILKGELTSIKEAMKNSGVKGMQTFDNALFMLYKNGKISLEEALKNADSRNDLEAKINFG